MADDIEQTRGISPKPAIDPRRREPPERRHGGGAGHHEREHGGHGLREPADVASVHGIPAREVTPRVQEALLELMGEMEDLRRQLDASRERESYLEKMADEDALLPVHNRRAFVRELSRFRSHSERTGTPSSLVYLDLRNAEALKAAYGLRALEGALIHVALILKSELRRTDVVGNLEGNGLGVLLAIADDSRARDKATRLVEAIEARPFVWLGTAIPLNVAWGVHPIRPGETPEDALDAADRDLRGMAGSSPNNDV